MALASPDPRRPMPARSVVVKQPPIDAGRGNHRMRATSPRIEGGRVPSLGDLLRRKAMIGSNHRKTGSAKWNGRANVNPSLVQVGLGALKKPVGTPFADGRRIAAGCIKGVPRGSHPRLYILWATPAFKDYKELLKGVHEELERQDRKAPLIGASVAVCLFEGRPYEKGAILICLASEADNLLHAKVSTWPNAHQNGHQNG